MNFQEAMRDLGRPQDWRESILSLRDEHGPGTSRWLASTFGVTMRTAQRWLAGTQAPGAGRRDAVRAAGIRARVAARALRNAQTLSVGRVEVLDKSTGKPAGTRPVGVVYVDTAMSARLGQVGELFIAGELEDAAELLSVLLLDAYSMAQGDAAGTASGPLLIYGYPTGIDVG